MSRKGKPSKLSLTTAARLGQRIIIRETCRTLPARYFCFLLYLILSWIRKLAHVGMLFLECPDWFNCKDPCSTVFLICFFGFASVPWVESWLVKVAGSSTVTDNTASLYQTNYICAIHWNEYQAAIRAQDTGNLLKKSANFSFTTTAYKAVKTTFI